MGTFWRRRLEQIEESSYGFASLAGLVRARGLSRRGARRAVERMVRRLANLDARPRGPVVQVYGLCCMISPYKKAMDSYKGSIVPSKGPIGWDD